ncbi:MAG TPA: TIGR03086 family metal-binding protein [Sporichthyaceae bacterium]|jgi:uncharacterized protein (TIGR03086 family)
MTDAALDVSEIRARYGRIAAGLDDRLARLTPDQWSVKTPCTEWDSAALMTHVVEVHRAMGAMLSGVAPEPVTVDTDLVSAWRAGRAAIESAMADESTATKVVDTGRFGTMPFGIVVGGMLCTDTIVHTWDLSRATGQDERLDPAGVAEAFALLKTFGDGIRQPGAFGPAVEPPGGADEQTQFLCYCGRAF